jgi:hypothetical protein
MANSTHWGIRLNYSTRRAMFIPSENEVLLARYSRIKEGRNTEEKKEK